MSGMAQPTRGRLPGTVAPKHYDCLVSLSGKYFSQEIHGAAERIRTQGRPPKTDVSQKDDSATDDKRAVNA
jgi:hypothetical protein